MGFGATTIAPISDFSGGLNAAENPLALKDNETPDCVNVHTNIFRSIEKRGGYTKLNTSAVTETGGNGLFDLALTDTNRKLVSVWDDKLYKMDSLDGTWDSVTLTVAIGDGRVDMVNYLNQLVLASWVSGNTQSWDGSAGSTSTISGVAAFKYLGVDQNTGRLWAAGRASFEGVGYFTPVNTLSFDTTNDSLRISAFANVFGYIELKAKFYAITNEGFFRIDDLGGSVTGTGLRFGAKFVTGPGTRSPHTAVRVTVAGLGTGIVYLDTDKRLQFFNGYETVPISLKFERRSSFSSAHTIDQINDSDIDLVHAEFWPKRNWYMLFYPSSNAAEHNEVLVYDLYMRSAWPFTNIPGHSATVAIDGSNTAKLYISGHTGYTWQLDDGSASDDGATITSSYDTVRRTPQRGQLHKWRELLQTIKVTGAFTLDLKARVGFVSGFTTLHSLDLSGSGDLLGTTFILGTSELGSTEAKITAVGVDLIGDFIQFRWEENSTNPSWQLFGAEAISKKLGIG